MKLPEIIGIAGLTLMLSCKSQVTKIKEDVFKSSEDLKTDTLKWLMYALNGNNLIALDTSKGKIHVSSVSSEVILINKYQHGDTLICSFSFVTPGYSGTLINHPLPVQSIGMIGSNQYILGFNYIRMDFQNYKDSVNLYVRQADSAFVQYLKKYDSSMSPWLMQEALRRKILKKASQ